MDVRKEGEFIYSKFSQADTLFFGNCNMIYKMAIPNSPINARPIGTPMLMLTINAIIVVITKPQNPDFFHPTIKIVK